MLVGGIAEMFLLDADKEHVLVRSRKGFVKAAIRAGARPSLRSAAPQRDVPSLRCRAGANIAPVYFFGNSSLLTAWQVPGLSQLSRFLRMAIIFPSGRWGLAMPRRLPITMARPAWTTPLPPRPPYHRTRPQVIGDPVPVRQCDDPTEQQVNETHAAFCQALTKTYNDHRHLYPGWKDRPLVLH